MHGSGDEELERIEIDLLLHGILRRYGYDFRGYAWPSLQRRLRRIVELEGVESVSCLQDRILRDAAAMDRFVANLSVPVTSCFRDPAMYRALRSAVLPHLRTYPRIRVWCAGCATGEEAYSVAILLHEAGLLERSRIYGTDLAESLLARAAAGVFPLESMRENTLCYQRAGGKQSFSSYYTTDHSQATFRRFLRDSLVFSSHNLVSDAPFNEFQLILCRNVLIYFDDTLRERVHALLYESLVRRGFLALGSREFLTPAQLRGRYEEFDWRQRLYRRA